MSEVLILIISLLILSLFGPAKDLIGFFKFIFKGDTNE